MQQQIEIAAKLYKCRDSARFLLGERYTEKMADYGTAIKRAAIKMHCSHLKAAMAMAERTDDGMLQMLIFAAAVELAEPSNAELSRPAANDHKPRRDREAGSA